MQKILYVATEGGTDLAASFDRADLIASHPGCGVSSGAVDVDDTVRLLFRRTDTLRWACMRDMGGYGPGEETIAHCVVTVGGGVDGRDPSDKGGRVMHAVIGQGDARQAEARAKLNGWTRLEHRVVKPRDVGSELLDSMTTVERACVDEYFRCALATRVDKAVDATGLPRPAADQAQAYAEACAPMVDDFVERIGEMTGTHVSDFHKALIASVLERIASSGPGLTPSPQPGPR